MTDKSSDTIVKVFLIVQSIALIAVALLLIISCVGIYRSGNHPPFSRDIVAECLLDIIAPVIVFMIITISGFIGSLFFRNDVKTGEYGSYKKRLNTLKSRFDISDICDCRIISMEKSRKVIFASSCVISTVALAFSLVYILFFAKLTVENLNSDIISLFRVILPCIIFSMLIALSAFYICEYSRKLEISYITEAIKTNKNIKKLNPADSPAKSATVTKAKTLVCVRVVLFALALLFIVLGVFNGGMKDVFGKAVQICTECIGLG